MSVIGTLSGTFLVPGVSANGRLYTPELIQKAVARMQERLADPDGLPITMLSHHAAGDDSKEIAGRIANVALNPDTYEATWDGYLVSTRAGKDIAATTDPGPDGRRTLDSVSIRGWWIGPVRTVDVDGASCETGDDIEVDGIDFTKNPGVGKARLASATRLAAESAVNARTPITESVEVQVMTDRSVVYSTSTPTPADVPPKPGSPAAVEHEEPAAAPADAAPQPAEQPAEAPDAPADDEPGDEATETTHPLAPLLAKIREAHVAIGGWQGPVDIDLDAWGLSNDDVAAAATQLGAAYTAALRVLDPDNDNDLDLPGGEDVEEEPCAGCGAALPSGAIYCPACGELVAETAAAAKAAATEKESTVPETKADETADKTAGQPAATETADAATEGAAATAATTETTETTETAAPAMTSADHEAIASLLHTKLTAAPAPSATETAAPAAAPVDTDAIAEAVKKATEETKETVRKEVADALRAEMLEAYGTPRRKGLVEAAGKGEPEKPLHKMSPEEFTRHAAQAWDSVLPS